MQGMSYMKITIREALKRASLTLKEAGISQHNYEAVLLLAFCLKKDLVYIYTCPEKYLTKEDMELYPRLLKKRSSGVPFHYIKGEKEFMGLTFKVNPGVLIPRPETELVAETALEWAKVQNDGAKGQSSGGGRGEGGAFNILDLCTGSGVLAVSLAYMLSSCSLWAADISDIALKTARENAARHGVQGKITFVQGDLWEPLDSLAFTEDLKFSIIVSNPPYISTDQLAQLPPGIKEHEPLLALEGGPDGLDFYRRIFSKLHKFLALPGITVLEVGLGQSNQVSALAEGCGLFREVKVIRDYSGIERIVAAYG